MQQLVHGPVILGPREEAMAAQNAASTRKPENADLYPSIPELAGQVVLPALPGAPGKTFAGVRDGNRSIILPDVVASIDGTGYALSVKGVGARPPLYGDTPTEFAFESDYGAKAPSGTALAGARQITAEPWFGESPYGAQGDLPAAYSLMVTGLSKGCQINGFYICPTVEVNELPPSVREAAHSRYWYRRHQGAYLQEKRLIPSNVRIYHESEWTLGLAPSAVLDAFGVRDTQAADAFIERFIASGVAALTLFVRTARPTRWGMRGLTYGDVYLDKDAVIAPNGRLHFVDIEGLDWLLGGADVPIEERVREQFNYNFYEFMYGLDLLLRERERLAGRPLGQDERRRSLPPRFELALDRDPFVRVETGARAMDIVVRPPFGVPDGVPVRVLDLR